MTRNIFLLLVVLVTGGCADENRSGDAASAQMGADGQVGLTSKVTNNAALGWIKYRDGAYAGSSKLGSFTDTHLQSSLRDFWSNDKYALHDRDGNGHFETVFLITDGKLTYVGSIGEDGMFNDVASAFISLKGTPIWTFTKAHS